MDRNRDFFKFILRFLGDFVPLPVFVKNKYCSDLVWVLKVIYEYLKKKKRLVSNLVGP
jgi:hypothetical protein